MHSSQLKEYNKTSHRIQVERILIVNVKEKLNELVGRRIRELNTTNAQIARDTGLSRGYIGNIVNETAPTQSGQYNLSPETVGKLAKALKIPESEILEAMDYLPQNNEEGLFRNWDKVPARMKPLVKKQVEAIIKAAIEEEHDFDYGDFDEEK